MKAKLAAAVESAVNRLDRRQRDRLRRFEWLMTGQERIDEELEEARRRALKTIEMALAGFALLILVSLFANEGSKELSSIDRPDYGEGSVLVPAVVSLEDGARVYSNSATLEIQPRDLTNEDAEALFDRCEAWLADCIKGENPGLESVFTDLFLPDRNRDETVFISWESSDPKLLGEDGRVSLWGAEDGQRLSLNCLMMAEGCSREAVFRIVLMPSLSDEEAMLYAELSRTVDEINAGTEEKTVELPGTVGGLKAGWRTDADPAAPKIALTAALLLAAIWIGRYESLEKKLKSRAKSLEDQTPEVMTRLVLLLDAGLVTESALKELAENSKEEDGPLFKALPDIRDLCLNSNISFSHAFHSFAVSGGIRELIRFSSLIEENASHGSELSDKLRSESARMHGERLNKAKARAKEAETKLCMPLMLLLVALLLVSAGPVLINMG